MSSVKTRVWVCDGGRAGVMASIAKTDTTDR